jgi:hypothetical protein
MPRRLPDDPFDRVRAIGLGLPEVDATVKYDGSPVLKRRGCFLAGLAMHPSAEPDSIVVRATFADRALLLEDAPDTYYVTDHYAPHPVVLVRLARVDRVALGDLLSVSWKLTAAKAARRGLRGEQESRACNPATPADRRLAHVSISSACVSSPTDERRP